ncbi:hypothetical protein [Erwinia sp.]
MITWLLFVLKFDGWKRGKANIITMAVLAVLLELAVTKTIYMQK